MKIISNFKSEKIPLPDGKPNIVWRNSRGLMCATVAGKDLPIGGRGSHELDDMLRDIEISYGTEAKLKFQAVVDEQL